MSILILLFLIKCTSTNLTISTHNLEINFGKNGKLSSVIVNNNHMETRENVINSGFYILEYPQKKLYKVSGSLKGRGKIISQEATIDEAQLRLEAQFERHDRYISVTGEVDDLSGEDRGIDVIYRLPVEGSGWIFWDDVTHKREIKAGGNYQNEFYPVGCISKEGEGGIALAVSAYHPCMHSVEYDPDKSLFLIRLKFGLTQDAKEKLKGKAPFKFFIYSTDAYWGFRDGLFTYYNIHPDIFKRKAPRDGLLLEGLISKQKKYNPKWNPDYFAYARVRDIWLNEEPERESLGIDSYQYVLPGQLEFRYLKKLPQNYDEAIKMFRNYTDEIIDKQLKNKAEKDSIHIWSVMPTDRDKNLKQWIENASLRDKEGRYIIDIRNKPWGGNMVTFPINPDPDLFEDKDKQIFSTNRLKKCVRILQNHPTYDGIFSDSFHGWGNYLNYRREHFAYTDYPLTHDGDGRVCIYNTIAHREWLEELKKRIKPYNAFTLGNGLRPNSKQWINAIFIDVLTCEHGGQEEKVKSSFPFYRVVAYKKPFIVATSREKNAIPFELFLKNCTIYGLLPTRMAPEVPGTSIRFSYAEQDEPLIKKYIPVIIKESHLGWEPVPHAVSSDPAVQVERFGPNNESLIFAIFNKENRSKSITLDIDTQALGIEMNNVKSLISKRDIPAKSSINLDLEANEIEVIQIGKSFGWESCL
jgi:hypothetical protein